jgi:hypothetical protein
MEDTQHNIFIKPNPLLSIKPLEEIKKQEPVPKKIEEEDIDVPELEEDEKDAIFMKPEPVIEEKKEETVELKVEKKKKRPLTEKQKAHMARMREAKAKKRIEKKKSIEPVQPIKKPPSSKPQEIPPPNYLNNQAYMEQFFKNMGMFMDSYNKLNSIKEQQKKSASKPVEKLKALNKATKIIEEDDTPTYIDWLKPQVMYENYKNPFGT